MRALVLVAALASLSAGPAVHAAGAKCRGAGGKFVKCQPAAAPAKAARCKDASGKFAKCGAAGARPAWFHAGVSRG